MLHASGKFVSTILDFLSIEYLSDDENKRLMNFHTLVLKLFKADSDEVKTEVTAQLDDMIPNVKSFAANFKKIGKNKEEGNADGDKEN